MRDLESEKILFIGAGNMAEALVKGLVLSDVCDPANIRITDVLAARVAHFQQHYDVGGSIDNPTEAARASLIVLAVKPQMLAAVLAQIQSALRPAALIVSIAAGITTARIEAALDAGRHVVRVMPNTPALVGAGMAAICGGRWAVEEDLKLTEAMLNEVGRVVRVPEEQMDAVTAISGSGPAYVFYLMEAMLTAAAQLGLEQATARQSGSETVAGAAKLLAETGEDAAVLRHKVTSKGGTTAAALDVLNGGDAQTLMVRAILAAHRRAGELSRGG